MYERARAGGLFVMGIMALLGSAILVSLYSDLKHPTYGLPLAGGILAVIALYCRHRCVYEDEPLMAKLGTWTVLVAFLIEATAFAFGLLSSLCC